ncbi:hypothetical protein ACFSQ7_27625 [Paenibacillus rhizoplanae]
MTKYISDNGQENRRINGQKNDQNVSVEILEGTAPILGNEIAITTIMSEKYGKQVGDNITFEIDGVPGTFMISGLFQSISNEGYAVWIARDYELKMVSTYLFSGDLQTPEPEKAAMMKAIQQQFPEQGIKTSLEMLEEITGGFMGQLQSINALLTAIICLITFFITSLFVRLMIAKEVYGIAVMKKHRLHECRYPAVAGIAYSDHHGCLAGSGCDRCEYPRRPPAGSHLPDLRPDEPGDEYTPASGLFMVSAADPGRCYAGRIHQLRPNQTCADLEYE